MLVVVVVAVLPLLACLRACVSRQLVSFELVRLVFGRAFDEAPTQRSGRVGWVGYVVWCGVVRACRSLWRHVACVRKCVVGGAHCLRLCSRAIELCLPA